MLSAIGLLVLVAIFAFAALLVALPRVLGRRERRRRADAADSLEPATAPVADPGDDAPTPAPADATLLGERLGPAPPPSRGPRDPVPPRRLPHRTRDALQSTPPRPH